MNHFLLNLTDAFNISLSGILKDWQIKDDGLNRFALQNILLDTLVIDKHQLNARGVRTITRVMEEHHPEFEMHHFDFVDVWYKDIRELMADMIYEKTDQRPYPDTMEVFHVTAVKRRMDESRDLHNVIVRVNI